MNACSNDDPTHLLGENPPFVDLCKILLRVRSDLKDATSGDQRCYRLPGPIVQVKAA